MRKSQLHTCKRREQTEKRHAKYEAKRTAYAFERQFDITAFPSNVVLHFDSSDDDNRVSTLEASS